MLHDTGVSAFGMKLTTTKNVHGGQQISLKIYKLNIGISADFLWEISVIGQKLPKIADRNHF
jgi:hypothetical protein